MANYAMYGKSLVRMNSRKTARIMYHGDDLGLKYRVQEYDKEYGRWITVHWTNSPLEAMRILDKTEDK